MRKACCVSLSKETYHKIHVLHSVKKWFFNEKDGTLSGIVEQAIKEYFENHKEEIDDVMRKYHEHGGCFDL